MNNDKDVTFPAQDELEFDALMGGWLLPFARRRKIGKPKSSISRKERRKRTQKKKQNRKRRK